MTELRGVEIFSAGTQTDSAGFTTDFTVEDIDRIIGTFNAGDPEFVPVKLGHTPPEFNDLIAKQLDVPAAALMGENGGEDGVVSLGRVAALRRVQNKLVADFDVPVEMADLVQRGYLRDVSVEMVGEPGNWKLTAVAWLGAELPAVKDLNGLAAAATLKRAAAPVMAFKRSDVFAQSKEKRMSLKDKLAAIFKDSDDDELKALFAEDEEDDEEREMEDGEDAVTVSPIGGEVAAAIRAMAGCDINCSDEELLEALRSLVGLPSATPVEEVVPVMKERLSTKPAKFSESAEYKTMKTKIATLERNGRLAFYRDETRGLLIQGKDEDLAEKLVDIESKSGEDVAAELLASWKRESESNRRYTQATGTSGTSEAGEPHEFEGTIEAYMSENKVDRRVALARLAMNPATSEAFNKYRRETSGATEA